MIVHDGTISIPDSSNKERLLLPKLGNNSRNNYVHSNKDKILKRKRGRPKRYFYPEGLDNAAKISITGDGTISNPNSPKKERLLLPKLGNNSRNNYVQSNKDRILKRKVGRPKRYFYPEDLDKDAKISITGEREVIKCCALACTNTSASFVMCKLPKDGPMRIAWIRKISRPGWIPTVDSALCQIHFEPDMWIPEPKMHLKSVAVPSMFLQGENIKSWVTMDNSGNVRNLVVGASTNGSVEDGPDEMDIERFSIKSEVLEPEIDMVVGGVDEETFRTNFGQANNKSDGVDDDSLAPVLTIKSVYSQDAECILPDLYRPSSPEVEQKVDTNGLGIHLLADQVKVFTCPLCAKNLSRRRSLFQHMQRIHPGTEETKKLMEERAQLQRRRENNMKVTTNANPAPVKDVSETELSKPIVRTVGTSPLPQPSDSQDPSKVKPFFLLIPANFQTPSCPTLATASVSPSPIPPSLANSSWDASDTFCVTLKSLARDTRSALKRKLMDLVEAVTVRNIPPQKIIIAYSNVNGEENITTDNKDNNNTPVIDVS